MGTAAALSFIKLWGCNSIRGRAMVWLRQWKVCWTHPSKKQVVQRYKRRKLMWMLFHMSILSCVACGPVGILLCLYWFSLPGALSSFCLCFSFLFFLSFRKTHPSRCVAVTWWHYWRRIDWKPQLLWSHCPAHSGRKRFSPFCLRVTFLPPPFQCWPFVLFCFVNLFAV